MSWLDPLLAIKTQQAGTTAGTRQTINFASGATVTDDPANDRVNVAITDTGITQLTGDVTAGPGSGSIAATVAKVNGVSVSGTPTSGQVIRATSGTASSWANVARGDITNTSGATGDIITGDATTLGRLAIGSTGQVLTVSGGAPVWASLAGSRTAIDADHMLVYYCNETSGTAIVNYGGATGCNLTIAGTYALDDKGLFNFGTGAIRFTATASTDGANKTGVSVSMPNAACTLECIIEPDRQPTGFTDGTQICSAVAGAFTSGILLQHRSSDATSNPNTIEAGLKPGSGAYVTCRVAYNDAFPSKRMHVAAVYNGSTLTLWINGSQVASVAASSNVLGTLDTISMGGPGSTQAWRGLMGEMRLSRVARDQTYLLGAAKTMGAL